MRHAAQTVEQAPVNSALLNVVTPMGLSFEKNRLSIGENIGKAYGIIRYPQKVDVEWLSKLTNIPSTLVSIGFKPVDNGTLINTAYFSGVGRWKRRKNFGNRTKCRGSADQADL